MTELPTTATSGPGWSAFLPATSDASGAVLPYLLGLEGITALIVAGIMVGLASCRL
ncbi:hypothetical protein [Arthrobacter sp. SO3]|uniref:hypothetical protein n=1 Tax=Arthrobacter sp. SO3 TaxID=1897057 RepID=UPI001CFF8653|nr:hypothetical protein [Arthrobacter sp. SO3]MCB5292394.1 hypothetical protein [Arthrobacter sp. SO3]